MSDGKGGCCSVILLIFVGLFVLVGLLKLFEFEVKKPSSSTAPPVPVATPGLTDIKDIKPESESKPQKPLTPADNLREAKNLLSLKSKEMPFGQIYEAERFLLSIKPEAAEYSEAQKLLKKIDGWKQKIIDNSRKEIAAELKAKRLIYAPIVENQFLDRGYDVTVKVEGKDATVLKIRWILVSRVLVHHISKDQQLIKTWRDMGFKKVLLTDGYRSHWEISL